MMDIGMYGHTQHNGPYGSPDPSFYNYSPGEGYSSNHGNHQTHHQYPSYNHEDAPGYSAYGEGSDTSSSNQENIHYYHQSHHQHLPENTNPSIISTEGGLSYTNLDYAQSNLYPNSHQNIYSNPNDFQREIMLQRHHQNDIQDIGHQNHFNVNHDSKYLPHQMCSDNEGYGPVIVQNSSCMEYQHLHRYKDDPGVQGENVGDCSQAMHHRSGHHLRHLPPAPAPPSVPTYKWMQVKRNVPKPSGK